MVLPSLAYLAGKVFITFVGRQPGLYFMRGFVDRSMDFEGFGWHRLFMERPDKCSLSISQTALVVAFFNEERGGVCKNLKSFFPRASIYVFSSLPPKGRGIHAAHHICGCLESAGLPIDPERSMECAHRTALLGGADCAGMRDKIVFHPGSGDLKKNHPPDFWIELLDRLSREAGFQNLRHTILLGPAEEYLYSFFREYSKPYKTEIRFSPDKDPLVGVLREAVLYMGHDSGITHLAAMLGTPAVALFRESDPNMWRPLGPYVRVIKNKESGPEFIDKVLEVSRDLTRSDV
jgi:hypothetical protein